MSATNWATDRLHEAGLTIDEVAEADRAITAAPREDLGNGTDLTSHLTVPDTVITTMSITTRQRGVLAGGPVAAAVFERMAGPHAQVSILYPDGAHIGAGATVMHIRGRLRPLLTAERTALNLLCLLSGVATATATWVEAIAGTGCAVRDTRKTVPGLRLLHKYAVRQGGGDNHRLGLWDTVLIKDNHVTATGTLTAAVTAARRGAARVPWEIEVDTLDQLDEARDLGAELTLLHNFTLADCAEAVRRCQATSSYTRLEASGRLTLEVARAYAQTGVHYLAVGSLTHSAPALDFGLDVHAAPGTPP